MVIIIIIIWETWWSSSWCVNLFRIGRSIKDWPIKEELWVGKNVSITDLQHGSGPATTRNCVENLNFKNCKICWNFLKPWAIMEAPKPGLRKLAKGVPQDLIMIFMIATGPWQQLWSLWMAPDYHTVDDKKMIANMTKRPPQIFSLPRWGRRCCPARAAPAGKSSEQG